MANIDRIVDVQISLATTGVREQSFSGLLLVGVHTGTNRLDIITSADDLLEAPFAGITTASPLYRAAQVAFSQIPGPRQVYIGRRGSSEAPAVALAAIRAENDDWYGFADVAHAEADLTAAAAWAEANEKLFLAVVTDSDAPTSATDDAGSALKTGNYYRTAWWYHPTVTEFPEVAAAARCFTVLPGGETWANKRLSAVPAPALTETAANFIFGKNGNTFEPFTGTNAITQNGKVAGGEWIDIIRFRDWLCQEIRNRVFLAIVNADKIPYTDGGIAIIRQAMIAALDLGVRRGGIAEPSVDVDNNNRIIPSYTTSVPARSQVSANDVANRILRDVTFTARLAGAIHAVEIRGTLTYDNIG
ncbi:hypothetical protein HMPREF9946_03143 [Acetobacteraceae bacterium AT-5844]|nr:hypothetical protein HMPREF9946_03143 [Acetobacteraceae bacterium AT-5844]